jgi:WD40 repeat protein
MNTRWCMTQLLPVALALIVLSSCGNPAVTPQAGTTRTGPQPTATGVGPGQAADAITASAQSTLPTRSPIATPQANSTSTTELGAAEERAGAASTPAPQMPGGATGALPAPSITPGPANAAGTTTLSGSGPVTLLRVLNNPKGGIATGIAAIGYSSDGQTLAAANFPGTIDVWQVAGGTHLRTITVSTGSRGFTSGLDIMPVAFSPDATLLAAGAVNNTVRLWSTTDGTLLRTLRGHTQSIRAVAFSPDGQLLASTSKDLTVRLWRVSDGTLLSTHQERAAPFVLAFSPDGRLLAAGALTGAIYVWDVQNGALVTTLSDPSGQPQALAFSPDGKVLASGSTGNTVTLWRTSDWSSMPGMDELDRVANVVWSPDGQLLASSTWGSRDKNVRLWHASDGQMLYKIDTGKGPDLTSIIAKMAFSPDGRTLAVAFVDNSIGLWSINSQALLMQAPTPRR